MSILKSFMRLSNKIRKKGNDALAETVRAVGEEIDESDLLTALADDVARAIADKYELRTSITGGEIVTRIVRMDSL